MIVTRRHLLFNSGLAGAGLVLLPGIARAQERADRDLHALLDAAAQPGDAAAIIDRLARIDPGSLSPSRRCDLDAALSGLRIDAQLARADIRMSAARYRLLLRRITSDEAEPAQIARRLENELRLLSARADRILNRLGHRTGSVGARYAAMWSDPAGVYPDDDAGRDRAVADMNRTLAVARAAALRDYPHAPVQCFDVAVRRMSRPDEAAGRAGYRELPTATRSGAYVVDLKDIRRRPAWTLPAVVRHETLPGHMIQLPVEAHAAPHPLRLKYAPGFAEGWAIHVERKALDRGAYATDPMAELGAVHWLLFRTGRALVDLGMHLCGWTRQDARARLEKWQGEPVYFAPFDTDLDRIIAEPGLRVAEAAAWLSLDDLQRRRGADTTLQPPPHGRVRNDRLA